MTDDSMMTGDNPQEPQEPQGPQELQGPQQPQGRQQPQGPQQPQGSQEPQEPQEPQRLQEPEEPEELQEPEEPQELQELQGPQEPDGPQISVAEALAEKIAMIRPGSLPASITRKCQDLLIDVVGLCVTARNEDYVVSALNSCDDGGICTAIGHLRMLTATGASFVNGTAAH